MRKTVRLRSRWAVRRRGWLLAGAAVLTALLVVLGLAAAGMSGAYPEGSAAGSRQASGAVEVLPAAPYPAGEPLPVPGDGASGGDASGGDALSGDASGGGVPGSDGAGFAAQAPAADGADRSSAKSGIMAAPETVAPAAPGSPATKIAPPEPGPVPDPGRGTVPPEVAPDRSVIRTARLTLDVRDLPAASSTVRDTAVSVGGFVAAEHSVERASSFTLRVPADRLDEVMGRLAGTGTVTERYGQAEDVTDRMVDLQSRLATQRASVARVRALLERANTVGEVVAVESEMASREAELESLQRRMASVSGRVALSTLTVALNPVPVAASEPDDGFLAGLAAGRRAFVATMGGVLTAVGVVVPFVLALAALLGAALLGRRAVRRYRAGAAALAAGDGSP